MGSTRPEISVIADTRALLEDAEKRLRAVLQEEAIMAETPVEAEAAMERAAEAIAQAIGRLGFTAQQKPPPGPREGPTRRQGQFLAFIAEYMMRHPAGVAPTHAEFQRFFELTPPSVNSMLLRLEQRGFIRRIPGQARAIELVIAPDRIPPLDRPFKV
jgi:hypothetical protein